MTKDSGIEFTPAYVLRRQIEAKEISPVEVVRNALDRVETLDGTLHSFFAVDPDGAMEAAREAERAVMMGEKLGSLHGIPTSIKDIEAVKGMRFTRGSMAFEHDFADEDALCVERLREAGAIIIGKTATPEFGHGGLTGGMLGVGCRNPWNPERTSGGSSSGAGASVAAGITPIAQGSDGGGSIRVPSAFCGIYGIKPTQGRVPRRDAGIASWAPFNMSTCGPMSRTVRDSAIMLQVMSGPGPDAEGCTIPTAPPDFEAALDRGVRRLRVAFSPDMGGVPVEHDVKAAAEAAAKAFVQLGADVEEDEPDIDDYEAVFRNWLLSFNVRAYAFDGNLLETHGELLGAEFRSDLEQGRNATALEYYEAISNGNLYRARVDRFLEKYDLLLTPALAVTAFEVGSPPKVIAGQPVPNVRASWPFFRLFNVTGHPAAVVPCGFSVEGLPFGLQIVGRMQDEETVLAASAAFEEAHPWADKRPPVS